MIYAAPGKPGSKVSFKKRYQNFIGGKWAEQVEGQYFENVTPVTGKPFCEVPRSDTQDIERAFDAAHAAKEAWGKTAAAQRRRRSGSSERRAPARLRGSPARRRMRAPARMRSSSRHEEAFQTTFLPNPRSWRTRS